MANSKQDLILKTSRKILRDMQETLKESKLPAKECLEIMVAISLSLKDATEKTIIVGDVPLS